VNNISANKKFISTVILLLCFVIAFAKAKTNANEETSEPKTFLGEWKINGAVKKLYDTPMGEVFKFSPSPLFSPLDKKEYDNEIYSIQFELYKNSKGQKKIRRFIVIDLKIRIFPAISEVENPGLIFSFTRSKNRADSIKKYRNINGIKTNNYTKNPYWQAPLAINTRFYNNKRGKNIGTSWGQPFLPAYEIVSMRLIIDTRQNGFVSSNVNSGLHISGHREFFPNKRYPVRSFGVLIESKLQEKKRLILELSRPKVVFTDNEADLPELPPIKPEKYPYSGYVKLLEESKKRKKNLKRLKNPDAIYGNALHLLDGKDLVEGVKLLTYIAKKKEHILAMNQLGICYWRGIGVKPDNEKALKWFKRAGEYNLPDALAFGGALCLKNASKPYLSPNTKKYIYYMLNHNTVKFNSGKHTTSVLSAILNHGTPPGPEEYERSAKLGYWMAKSTYLFAFYRNSLYEDEGPRIKDANIGNGKYLKNKFYDPRIVNLACLVWYTNGTKTLDKAIEANFPVAIYHKGQLLVLEWDKTQKDSFLQEAITMFERGEKLGNIECAIEVLHCKARFGELKPEDFTTETYVKFSDHPLYYLLRHIVKNPNAPGNKEFLNRQYREARRIWRKNLSPDNHFLLALEGIYQYYHYGADTAMYRIYYRHIHDLKVAYKHLNAAVKANIQDALYLKGVYYLNKKYNSFAGLRGGDISEGIRLLRKVEPTNIKAKYYLIKNDFYNNRCIDKKWLKTLKPLRDLNFSDAWMLSSDILARLYLNNITKRGKVIGAYKKAAALGCVRAWDRLAMLYYKNGKGNTSDKAAAEKYWKKFLEADKKQRRNDPWDPYWPKPKPSKLTKPIPVELKGKLKGLHRYKKLLAHLRKHYKFVSGFEEEYPQLLKED